MNELVKQAHDYAVDKGFWYDYGNDAKSLIVKLALISTEVSEAIEDVRTANRTHLGEELADIAIRLADFAGALDIDLDDEINKKMEKNLGRPYMHGKFA